MASRSRVRAIAAASVCSLFGCSDASSPARVDPIPDFVFVSDETGRDRLYVYSNGAATPFPGTEDGDADPQSAHGRVVFSSIRESETNAEIFSAKLDGSDVQRLTTNTTPDVQPSLSPDGRRVAYVSLQGGVSRLWTMNADGSSPAALETGSDAHTLESMPRFSPDGHAILFNSSRTGTSQLWEMDASGGAAVQLTHETSGAFDGSWGADGTTIFYVAGLDFHTVHELDLVSGTATAYAVDSGSVSAPECNADLCLVVSTAAGRRGDIVAYVGSHATSSLRLVAGSATEREPAILHP